MPITHEFPLAASGASITATSRDTLGQCCQEFETETSRLRDLVHELRQPLSTIEALTSYLELVCVDERTRASLERIQEMLLQANYILERASDSDFH